MLLTSPGTAGFSREILAESSPCPRPHTPFLFVHLSCRARRPAELRSQIGLLKIPIQLSVGPRLSFFFFFPWLQTVLEGTGPLTSMKTAGLGIWFFYFHLLPPKKCQESALTSLLKGSRSLPFESAARSPSCSNLFTA